MDSQINTVYNYEWNLLFWGVSAGLFREKSIPITCCLLRLLVISQVQQVCTVILTKPAFISAKASMGCCFQMPLRNHFLHRYIKHYML